MIIQTLPDTIDLKQSWLVEYWAKELGVSFGRVSQAVQTVGPSVSKVRALLNDGYRIGIRDESGTVRLVSRILAMKDGVAASVPYHPVKNGWLFKTPIQYDRREYVAPLSESKHFTVSSTVKLSLHMDGFVQFSSGDGQRIISGYNHEIAQAKGLGQKAPNPIRVSTGPLFGIVLQGLHEFKERSTELVELFETEDLWRHYRFTSKEDTAYNLEVFMFPLSLLSHAVSIGNKRILRRYLPFEYIIAFPFDLRVIEIPHQPFFLGLILSRVGTDSTITSGYKLGGPGFGGRGEQKKSIGAWYPCPDLTAEFNPTSLDYRRDQETDA